MSIGDLYQYIPRVTAVYPTGTEVVPASGVELQISWNVSMETTQFSNSSSLAKFIQLRNDDTGDIVPISYDTYLESTRTLKLDIDATLESETNYRVTVFPGVQSTQGRKMGGYYQWQFTTAESAVASADLTLINPLNYNTYEIFPLIEWSGYDGLTQVQISTDGQFNTLIANVTASGTYLAYGGTPTSDTTYFVRVRPVSGTASGTWSDSSQFYYGSYETSHPSTKVSKYTEGFYLRSGIDTDFLSNQSDWPTLRFTFNKAVDTDNLGVLQAYKKAVLVRNDDTTTRTTTSISGSWTATGTVVEFTPSDAIESNTQYTFLFPTSFTSDSGDPLAEPVKAIITGPYTPLYCDFRMIQSRFRREMGTVTEDFINWNIHLASLGANARYQADLLGLDSSQFPATTLSEADVRSPELTSHAVLHWTYLEATKNILYSIWTEEVRNVGTRKQLADYEEQRTYDFVRGVKDLLDNVEQEQEKWEELLYDVTDVGTISKGYLWNPHSWHYQNQLWGDAVSRRYM